MGKAESYFRQFAFLANKSCLHPNDWGRFYRFLVIAHSLRLGWSEADVRAKLTEAGFRDEYAQELAAAYWHARCALYVQNHMNYNDSYIAWMRKGGTPLT